MSSASGVASSSALPPDSTAPPASSPSGFAFASTPSSLEKRKHAQAADVCAHLRKLLDAYRLYTPGHATLKGFLDALFSRLTAYLHEYEELSFAITAGSLAVDGHIVFAAERRDDSISHALFLDGLKGLTFLAGIDAAQLEAITRLWRDALDGSSTSDQNFITRFWEAGFEAARIVAIETFAEEDDGKANPEKQKNRLEAVMTELVTERLASTGTVRSMHVSHEDLEVLKLRGVADLTGEDLAAHATADVARALESLSADEQATLRAELTEPEDTRLERALHALSWATQFATSAETDTLLATLRQLISLLAQKGKLDLVTVAFKNAVLAVRSAPTEAERRIKVVKLASENLGHPQVLEAVLPLLDDAATADSALAALRFLQPSAIAALFDRLPSVRTADGRKRLIELLAAGAPKAEEVSKRIASVDEDLAELMLALVKETDPKWWQAMKAALGHPSKAVQRAVVQRLTRDKVLAHRQELYPLAGGDDPEIRHALLPRLVSAKDPGVVVVLAKLLAAKKTVGAAERKSLLVALGMLGGEAACALLKKTLTGEDEDVELRAAAALALGHAGDASAKPLLETHAKKLLGRGPLKDACAEALKRLEAHKP